MKNSNNQILNQQIQQIPNKTKNKHHKNKIHHIKSIKYAFHP